MKASLTRVFAGIFALAVLPLMGCSSDAGSSPAAGSGGSTGGEATTSSSVSAGGTTTSPTSSGGVVTTGGTPASGGQSHASSVPQGGATGGAVTSAAGQSTVDSSAGGGGAAGGASAKGGSVAGGSVADAGVIGGSPTGDAAAGGKSTAGGSAGAPDGAATGGKMTTDGAAGGTVTGGTSAVGGSPPLGGGKGSSDGKTPITVWMSGDSTMAGDKCAGGGWGDQFGSLFNSNVTVQNKSVAGRSIQTWLYEKNVSTNMVNGECALTATTYSDNWNSMLTGMKAGDWLFIEFGINDGDGTCPRHVGTALFQTYLTTMAKAASDRGAQAIFLTSTSYMQCTGSTVQPNRGFGPETRAAGTADNVPVIDMTVLTANLYTSLGLCPNAGDYTSTTSKVGLFFCNDHTHFEAAGALQIAKTAAQALKDQGIGLAAYLLN
jgi:lysophospholipase L1-like esterase